MCKWEWKKISTLVTKCQNIKWDKVPLDDSRLYIDLSSVNKDTQCIEDVSEVNVENAPSRAKQIIHENDVLFATTRPTQKRVCIVERQYDNQICSTGFCVLRPLDCLESKYLFYCLLSDDFYSYIKPLEKGANYPAVTDGDVKNYEIPVPPLSEQKRIVKFLDEEFSKIETLKTNAETNLKNAKELFETTLEKELNPLSRHSERSEESSADLPSGWEWKILGDVCEKISDGSHNPPKGTAANEYKMLSSKNIFNDSLNFDDPRFLTKEEFDLENKRTNVKKGDILLTIVGTIGRCCVFLEDEPVVFQRSVAVLKPNVSLVYSRFLMYGIIALNIEKLGRGAAQKGVYLKQLSNISIPLPPLSVQKEIVSRLDKLSENVKRLEANYKQIIANCDELKKTTLKQTFQGGN